MQNLPADAATVRAEIGDAAAWPIEAHLLAGVYDQLAQSNWQRSVIYGNGRTPPKPKPIPRPGVAQPLDGRRLGGKGYSIDEFDRLYAEALTGDLVLEEVSVGGG